MLLGQHESAREAAEVLTSRFPLNMILQLTCAATDAAALAAQGHQDAATQLLKRMARVGRSHSAHFLALMLAMDLHGLASGRDGDGGLVSSGLLLQDALALAGGAISAMDHGAVHELRPVLVGRGIDLDTACGAAQELIPRR